MNKLFIFSTTLFIIGIILILSTTSSSSIPIHHSNIKLEFYNEKLNKALALLDKHPDHKKYVEDRLTSIKSGRLSRVIVSKDEAVFHVSDKYIDNTSIEWLASTLVHEAKHVDQRRPFLVFDGQTAELDANNFQAMALADMGGTRSEIKNLMEADGLHFDSNGNGKLDKDDDWGY